MTVLVCSALAGCEEPQLTPRMQVEIGGPLSVGMTATIERARHGEMVDLCEQDPRPERRRSQLLYVSCSILSLKLFD